MQTQLSIASKINELYTQAELFSKQAKDRKLTVDAGREEQQNRVNVEMGLKTLEESYSECGLDFEDEMRTRADNARFIMRLAGIPDSEPIPLYMLYKINGTQVIENRRKR